MKADKDSAGAEYRLPSSHTVTYWLVQNHGPGAKTKRTAAAGSPRRTACRFAATPSAVAYTARPIGLYEATLGLMVFTAGSAMAMSAVLVAFVAPQLLLTVKAGAMMRSWPLKTGPTWPSLPRWTCCIWARTTCR